MEPKLSHMDYFIVTRHNAIAWYTTLSIRTHAAPAEERHIPCNWRKDANMPVPLVYSQHFRTLTRRALWLLFTPMPGVAAPAGYPWGGVPAHGEASPPSHPFEKPRRPRVELAAAMVAYEASMREYQHFLTIYDDVDVLVHANTAGRLLLSPNDNFKNSFFIVRNDHRVVFKVKISYRKDYIPRVSEPGQVHPAIHNIHAFVNVQRHNIEELGLVGVEERDDIAGMPNDLPPVDDDDLSDADVENLNI